MLIVPVSLSPFVQPLLPPLPLASASASAAATTATTMPHATIALCMGAPFPRRLTILTRSLCRVSLFLSLSLSLTQLLTDACCYTLLPVSTVTQQPSDDDGNDPGAGQWLS